MTRKYAWAPQTICIIIARVCNHDCKKQNREFPYTDTTKKIDMKIQYITGFVFCILVLTFPTFHHIKDKLAILSASVCPKASHQDNHPTKCSSKVLRSSPLFTWSTTAEEWSWSKMTAPEWKRIRHKIPRPASAVRDHQQKTTLPAVYGEPQNQIQRIDAPYSCLQEDSARFKIILWGWRR